MDYSLVRVLSLYRLTTIYIRDVELTEPKEEGLNKSKPYSSKILVNISYLRNDISISLALSAIALLLLASPLLPLSNLLLQPVQAQSNLSFRTPIPANGTTNDPYLDASLTFDAQGETFVTPDRLGTNGTFQITDSSSGQILFSGTVFRVQANSGFANVSNSGKQIIVFGDTTKPQRGSQIEISTSCSTSASNEISVTSTGGGDVGDFSGPVECSSSSSSQGGGTTTQPSSPMTGTTQDGDSDGDGIPDSGDRCTHTSNPRCFKEGDTNTTSTHEQEQPPSSTSSNNRTGNQTR
jgi:hypothetical protein